MGSCDSVIVLKKERDVMKHSELDSLAAFFTFA